MSPTAPFHGRRFSKFRLLVHTKYFAKFVFVHINKAGGVSVERALGLPEKNHTTALEYRDLVGVARWRKLFTFSVVRNPWDRVVSHYHYRIKTGQTGMGSTPISFGEWVRLAYRDQDPQYFDDPKFFAPQSQWLEDESGELLVDFVCQLERIDKDFAHVCKSLEIQAALPHLNRTARGQYRDYYDAETEEIVRRWFARDIERFGYEY